MKKGLIVIHLLICCISLMAQNVGIGTLSPQARLHVADSSVLFSGPSSLPVEAGGPPASGGGTRMMWYAGKAAFRAGQVSSTDWNETSIGLHSLASGYNVRASGQYAIAFGNNTDETGVNSFSWGNKTTASGQYAMAIGQSTTASSYGSLVAGRYNVLSGSGTAWNETDPLFVLGNGYETVENNILTITRRNALLIKKNADAEIGGNTLIKKSLTINDSLMVQGGTGITGNAIVNGLIGVGIASPKTSLDLNGALALRSKTINITSNNQLVDAGNASFVLLTGSLTGNTTIQLRSGEVAGQVLILNYVGSCGNCYIVLSNSQTLPNLFLGASSRSIGYMDTLLLLYNGYGWVELNYSNN